MSSRTSYPSYPLLGRLSLREFLWFWAVLLLLFVSLVISTNKLVNTLRNIDPSRASVTPITSAAISYIAAYNYQPPRKKSYCNFCNKRHCTGNETNITAKKHLAKGDFCKQTQKRNSVRNDIKNHTSSCFYFEEIRDFVINAEENLNIKPMVPPLKKVLTIKEIGLSSAHSKTWYSVLCQFFRKIYHTMAMML